MLTLPPSVRIYVAAQPVDARKSFDGLVALVESEFGLEPLSGHLFVFLNRRGHVAQLLFWDRNGFCILNNGPLRVRNCGAIATFEFSEQQRPLFGRACLAHDLASTLAFALAC